MITPTKVALVAVLILSSTTVVLAQGRAHAMRHHASAATHFAQSRDTSCTLDTHEGDDWTRAGGVEREKRIGSIRPLPESIHDEISANGETRVAYL